MDAFGSRLVIKPYGQSARVRERSAARRTSAPPNSPQARAPQKPAVINRSNMPGWWSAVKRTFTRRTPAEARPNTRSESARASSAARRERAAVGAVWRGEKLGQLGKAIYNAPGKAVGFLGRRYQNTRLLASRAKHAALGEAGAWRRTMTNLTRSNRNKALNRYKRSIATHANTVGEFSARRREAEMNAEKAAIKAAEKAVEASARKRFVGYKSRAQAAADIAAAKATFDAAATALAAATEAAAAAEAASAMGSGSARSGSSRSGSSRRS